MVTEVVIANVSKIPKYFKLLPDGVDREPVGAGDVSQIIREIFHPRSSVFKRASFIQTGIDKTHQIDLMDISNERRYNSGRDYLFLNIKRILQNIYFFQVIRLY